MGCFSGRLMSSASDQKLFCEICSAFNYSFDEFVGEKVVSRSYSSAILAPPQTLFKASEAGGPVVLLTGMNNFLSSPNFGSHFGVDANI